MKVRIKSGVCPSYLTLGKVYDAKVIKFRGDDRLFEISDDDNDPLHCVLSRCAHLNNGSWEIVEE